MRVCAEFPKFMNDEIESVRISFDLNGTSKITKYKNGTIQVEPISGEEAALIHVENGGY